MRISKFFCKGMRYKIYSKERKEMNNDVTAVKAAVRFAIEIWKKEENQEEREEL